MCPYYLDGDRTESLQDSAGDTRCHPRLSSTGDMWLLCSFQGPSEKATRTSAGTVAGGGRRGLSKLNSMHGLELGVMPRWPGQVRSTC
jgi:hypothetical protein